MTLFFVPLLLYSVDIIMGEYYIKDGHHPMYMFATFKDIDEEIFPKHIQIRLSLNKIAGTLLYSIDKHMNQLMIRLDQGVISTLITVFRSTIFYTSLNKLCGCTDCRYQMLDVTIIMENAIYLKCNGGKYISLSHPTSIKLNENYPIPFQLSQQSESSKNEANIWFVNVPRYSDEHPDNIQLTGCIHTILYNGQPVTFTNMSEGIDNKCTKACDSKICNGGKCYETYNKIPVCDCTLTYQNGLFCNDTIRPTNIRSDNKQFIFDKVKVSWKSSERDIFTLKNSVVQIQLNCVDGKIYFDYTFFDPPNVLTKGSLTHNYVPNTESIFIAYFNDASIDVKLFNKGSWSDYVMIVHRKLKDEIFDSITMKSGDGDIDVAYMVRPMDDVWTRVVVSQYENISYGLTTTRRLHHTTDTFKDTQWRNMVIIVAVVSVLSVIVAISVIVIYQKRNQKKNRKYKHSTTLESGLPKSELPSLLNDHEEEYKNSSMNESFNSENGSTECEKKAVQDDSEQSILVRSRWRSLYNKVKQRNIPNVDGDKKLSPPRNISEKEY